MVDVLIVIDALGEGGTERSMADLVRAMRPMGVDATFATLRTRGREGVERGLRADGFDVRLLPAGRARIPTLRALVREERPALVHSMLYESNLVVRLGSVGLGVPVLTSLVNTSYSPERRATRGSDPWKLELVRLLDLVTGKLFVDRFHAVSEAVADDAIANLAVPRSKISVVPRGRPDPADTVPADARARIRAELGIPVGDRVAINVGRHEHQKDHATLVRAMGPVLADRPDTWLLIAGRDGNATSTLERALDEVAIATPDARERIVLLGHRGDVSSVLAASDLFVMASHYEGMPGAVIEAMAAGLPVVATDIGPVREVVTSDTAVLAQVGDAEGLRAAVVQVLDDPVVSRALGSAGRDRFEQAFEIGESARRLVDLYHLVAESRTGRATRIG